MANPQEGRNPGYTGQPARQGVSRDRQGNGSGGSEPTAWDETPADLFGVRQSYSTGLAGSAGAQHSASVDVTNEPGQLEDGGLSSTTVAENTESGLSGSTGASPARGGETVTYTDPWAVIGGVTRDNTVQGEISGVNDWTKCIDGYSPGQSLPGLENNRPTDTGVGSGHARTELPAQGGNHPNAGR